MKWKEGDTVAGRTEPKKVRNFMYEQQVSYLPNKMTPDEIYDFVEQTLKPKRIASILHDKDMKDDNITPAEAHIHMMLQFENARSVNQVAKDIGDKPERLQIWKNNVENGFSYLIHATDNSRHKHQYSCDEVRANFDYPAFIQNVAQKVKKIEGIASANKINGMLDLIATGEMTLAEAKAKLTGSQYAKVSEKIKKAHELYLDRCAEKLHQEMVENDELVEVHWLYGESETGKSYIAEKLAKESGAYYKTSTTTDPFQFYQGESIIILDELRPEVVPYSELLTLLNPFSRGKVAVSSRYFNKSIACKVVYITTPYSPTSFYHQYRLNTSDKGEQLFRRLSSVLKFDMNWIYRMEYQAQAQRYIEVDKKENHYSRKKQKTYSLNNIFDKII
jgi:hypothetical protein